MLIAIDAGHYLGTPGKRCLKSIDPGETREWVLNNRVAHKVQVRLTAYDCTTMRVDDPTGQNEVDLVSRVLAANRAKADVYLSIHHNAGINGGSGGGIVVYVCPGVGEDTTSLQRAVYEHTVATTGLRGNRSHPLAEADFYVLLYTKMPAVLGEFGFMDSTTDTPIIITEAYADKLADGIVAALVEQYQLKEADNMLSYEKWVEYMDRYRKEMAEESTMPDLVADAVALGISSDGSRPGDFMTREEGMVMARAAVRAAKKDLN
ncbi:N-acetylmuramoyl-L-alanine amidase [Lawsonibacter sp. LCP25S3_G6]|uniref:N-acetylmuramoyl-L-alanine amidase n=1 Tax=unclassified Lawsonibacter TaxID=2617946 RepID=UPI003F9AADEF